KAKRTTKGTAKGESDSRAAGISAEADGDDAFQKFWEAYPRKKAKPRARREWVKAIKAGADAQVIIAAAKAFAVERANEPAKWTPYACNWLSDHGWQDKPPGAPIIDEQGNVVAYERPERPQRSGYGAVGDDLIARYEAGEKLT